MTFFSQTSPKLYSSSQASRATGSGRRKTDSFPSRSTMTTSSGSNSSRNVLDCVLIEHLRVMRRRPGTARR